MPSQIQRDILALGKKSYTALWSFLQCAVSQREETRTQGGENEQLLLFIYVILLFSILKIMYEYIYITSILKIMIIMLQYDSKDLLLKLHTKIIIH